MLKREMRTQGQWLFSRRGYLPLPVYLLALGLYIVSPGVMGSSSDAWTVVYQFAALGIALVGSVIRLHVRGIVPDGTSGRNRRGQVATVLNTDGFYSIVRHPLYLGNFLIFLGVALFPGVWWLPVMLVLLFWLYYERIMMAEEAFLEEKFGDAYREWSAARPAFVPRLGRWQRARDPFRIAVALRRERSSLLSVGMVFGSFKLADYLLGRPLLPSAWIWLALALGTLLLYCFAKLFIHK